MKIVIYDENVHQLVPKNATNPMLWHVEGLQECTARDHWKELLASVPKGSDIWDTAPSDAMFFGVDYDGQATFFSELPDLRGDDYGMRWRHGGEETTAGHYPTLAFTLLRRPL